LWYSTAAALPIWRLDAGTVPDMFKIRPVGMIVGDPDPASPTLTSGNDTPSGWMNHYGRDLRIIYVGCKANVANVTIDVLWEAGGATSVLTGSCTCGNGAFNACTVKTTTDAIVHSTSNQTCTTNPCGLTFDLLSSVDTANARYVVIDGYGKLQ